ncbi:hypothetical protein MMC20_002727 [Loxospora ochrophaea]|nr:hypothetical protein [Loxospora ochrophaea]
MSQMRIWKTVRERRGKKIQQQLEQSCRREQDEEELGRRLEEDNERERAIWEAAYGKRDSALLESTDSGIGTEGESSKSTRRPSMNVESRQLASATESHIELDDLKNPNSFPSGGPRLGDNKDQELAVATVIKDDTTDVHVSPTAENPYTGKPCVLISSRDLGTESSIPRSTESSNSEVKNPTRKSHVVIIRKPVGGEATVDNNAHEQIDDGSSPATYVTSQSPEAESLNGELCLTRAIEFSKQSQRARSINLVAEGLCIPTIEEDRTSSIAATLDALEDYSGTSEDLASVKQDEALASTSTDTGSCAQEDPEEHGSLLKEAPNEHVSSRASIYTDADAVAPSLSPSTLSQPYSKKLLDKSSEDGQVREQVRPTELPLSDDFNDRDRKFVQLPVPPATGRKYRKRSHLQPVTTQLPEGSFVSDEPSVRTSLERQLPAGTNKVVVAHRTNEWAKRLNRADKPELEELRLDQLSPELTRGHMDQPPVPVDMEELRQTAAGSGLESISESMHYVSRSSSNTLSISVGHQPTQQLQVASNKRSLAERPNGLSYRISHENPSSKELRGLPSARTPLHPATMSAGRATRSSSSPLITSLIEGDEETSFPSRCAPGVANNTLIAQRDSMVRDRYSSISKSRDSQALRSATSLSSIRAPIPQGSLTALDDDIPLSQRRSLIQMQQSQSPDSRRPFRSITDPAQQESLLAAWRSSIQQDIASAQRPQLEVEARRTEMMNEKRISSLMKQQAALAHRTRKETRDQEIKRGLHDLHREGIHRMQAKANKNLQDL